MTIKEKQELIKELIVKHKKVYQKRLSLLFSEVFSAIESEKLNSKEVSLYITPYGYSFMLGEYSSVIDKDYICCNLFRNKDYLGLISNQLFVCKTESEMQKILDKRINFIDKHLSLLTAEIKNRG